MNNDIKTTITGLVTTIATLLSYFGIIIPETWYPVIIAVGFMVVSYFTNKKEK